MSFRFWPFSRRRKPDPPSPDPVQEMDEPDAAEEMDEPFEIIVTPLAGEVWRMLRAGWSHDQVVWVLQMLEERERKLLEERATARAMAMQMSTVSTPTPAKRQARRVADSQVDSQVAERAEGVDKLEAQRERWRRQKANQRQKLNGSAGGQTDNVHRTDNVHH
jgi:hypothetical protein